MNYKDLTIWRKNQSCIKNSAKFFKKLPKDRVTTSIIDQLFRSLTSIGANLAEGSGNYKGQDFPRYLNIAFRSALEADHWLETAKALFEKRKEEIESIREY